MKQSKANFVTMMTIGKLISTYIFLTKMFLKRLLSR